MITDYDKVVNAETRQQLRDDFIERGGPKFVESIFGESPRETRFSHGVLILISDYLRLMGFSVEERTAMLKEGLPKWTESA